LHAGHEPVCFTLPKEPWTAGYQVVVDTTYERGEPPEPVRLPGGHMIEIPPRTFLLLQVSH
jgi:hypothetical protein